MNDIVLSAAQRVQQALHTLGMAYEIMPCDPELADTAVFCEHYGIALENSANTILVTGKTGDKGFVVCVLLAHTRLDVNKVVRKRMGVRRISFASAEQTRELTGMELGGVTPIDLPDNLPVWVDSRIMDCDYIILGGGDRTSKIKIPPQFFLHTANTEIVADLAKESA